MTRVVRLFGKVRCQLWIGEREARNIFVIIIEPKHWTVSTSSGCSTEGHNGQSLSKGHTGRVRGVELELMLRNINVACSHLTSSVSTMMLVEVKSQMLDSLGLKTLVNTRL